VYCRVCALYDPEGKRCKDGKVNPQNWEMAVTVAQVHGLRSICAFNDYRERLVRSRTPMQSDEQRRIWKD
jgi:hypothetical protein